jgi:aminoglycoside phosphotransferase family enzyme
VHVVSILPGNEIELGAKVAFLSRTEAYSPPVNEVARRETHMSWVFLTGDTVYKLKKPVRFPYLDFSTLTKREAACRAELRLNRRLAPDVYLDVAPLRLSAHGFAIGGERGLVVDWLVVMHRLDERAMLEHAIAAGRTAGWQLDQLADALVHFYRRAIPAFVAPERHLSYWWQSLSYNRRVLLEARFGLPVGLVSRVDQALRRFLARQSHILAARVRERHLVDGHGDLRPEHIWLGDPVKIIDCLEFNDRLRMVDPFDEIAFLDLECERLGAAWIGRHLHRKVARGLCDGIASELYLFYRCHRATLRARLAIAHLMEPNPRTPEKWPNLARSYLRIAKSDAVLLDRLLRTRGDRRASASRASGGWPLRTAAPTAEWSAYRVAHRRRAGTAESCR